MEPNGNSEEVIETEVISAVNVVEEVATTSQEVNVKESRTNEWVKSTTSDRSSRTTSIDVEAEDKEEEVQFKPPPPPPLLPQTQQSVNQNNNTLQQSNQNVLSSFIFILYSNIKLINGQKKKSLIKIQKSKIQSYIFY